MKSKHISTPEELHDDRFCQIGCSCGDRWIAIGLSLSNMFIRGKLVDLHSKGRYHIEGADELSQSYDQSNWFSGVMDGALYAFRELQLPRQVVSVSQLTGRLGSTDMAIIAEITAMGIAKLTDRFLQLPSVDGWLVDVSTISTAPEFDYSGPQCSQVRSAVRPKLESSRVRAEHFIAVKKGARLKRVFDVIVALIGGVIVLPVFVLIAIAIKLTSRGPIFYAHWRIGRYGHKFKALKFRTMVTNSDEVLSTHLTTNPSAQDMWKREHKLTYDPRVTGVGRVLRKTGLDELPQLWNVLCGDMSLVGPRPIAENEVSLYGDDFDIYLHARPGITGLWQVSADSTTYQDRVLLDVKYFATWSVGLDLKILFRTMPAVIRARKND
jgi:lipopolysaccharide/colanic/teichoic acid biosynthesis glycosyltransferase